MNAVVKFGDFERQPMRLDRRAVEALHDAGVLDGPGKVELIDGVLIRMSPSHSPHGFAISYLSAAIVPDLPDDLIVGSDIGVFLAESQMRAPDIGVYRRTGGRKFLPGDDLVWAIEISASPFDEDIENKAEDYSAYAIAEYWIVDLAARKLHIHRDPSAEGYRTIRVQDWSEPATPLCASGLHLDLAHVLRKLP